MANLLDPILQGLLLGGLYTMFAIGLSLIFGVMRLVNIAHGDFIVLAAYLGHVVLTATGWHPLLALVVVAPVMAALGYALQRLILARTIGDRQRHPDPRADPHPRHRRVAALRRALAPARHAPRGTWDRALNGRAARTIEVE